MHGMYRILHTQKNMWYKLKGELDSCPYNFQKLEICPYNSRNWRFALHILALPELCPFLRMKPSWTHLQHLYFCIDQNAPLDKRKRERRTGWSRIHPSPVLFPSPSRVLSPSRLSPSCVLPLSPSTNPRTGEWRQRAIGSRRATIGSAAATNPNHPCVSSGGDGGALMEGPESGAPICRTGAATMENTAPR